ncbi:MAG: FGGY family carbohydrate kinase [Paracoccaceae bacterium]
MTHILAIDQGTTSSRAIIFDASLKVRAVAQEEFPQHYPSSGWVEHDPSDLWSTVAGTARAAIEKAGIGADSIKAIGITNQRETTLIWDRATGEPIHRAIVWQDRRTADICAGLKAEGHEPMITARTGLLLDPYFSGTKIKWLLDHVPGARPRGQGRIGLRHRRHLPHLKLTGGRVHATDATNAARTLIYNIAKGEWDADICALLDIPMSLLPEVKDCAADYGTTRPDLFGRAIPDHGRRGRPAGRDRSGLLCPGMMKSTYGTGCFALLNTGTDMVPSQNRLLTTIAYRLNGQTTYALEGSIFIAGAVVQWLRDGLKIIREGKRNPTSPMPPTSRRTSSSSPPSPASARPTGGPIAVARSTA